MNQNKPPAAPSSANIPAVYTAGGPPDSPPSTPGVQIAKAAQALSLDAAWATDTGRARDHNEDAIGGTPLNYPPAATRGYLYIVADGMGGHNAGEVASNEAAKRVYQRYYADSEPNPFRSLERAMRLTNNELYQQSQADPAQRGMGTTMTALVIKDNHVTVAHVGDSRLYLIRGGKIEQVTHDHSWVEEQVRAGVLTRLQAESHPQRNVITRALATAPDIRVDPFDIEIQAGDILVFCSDGLNTEVGDAQIAALATKATSSEEAVQRLIQLANENGGEDNVSVGVIRVLEAAAAPIVAAATVVPEAASAAASRKVPILPIIGGIAALVVIVGAVVVLSRGLLDGSRLRRVEPPATVLPVLVVPTATLMVADRTATPTSSTAVESTMRATAAPVASVATATLAPTATPVLPSSSPAIRGGSNPTSVLPRPTALPTKGTRSTANSPNPPLLEAPPDNDTRNGTVEFKWQPAGALPTGTAYEIVAWHEGENPNSARGIAPATDKTSDSVDVDGLFNSKDDKGNPVISKPEFYWTVIIVQINPYERLTTPEQGTRRKLVITPHGPSQTNPID